MRPTRRSWAALALVPLLALSAVVLSQPPVLFGAATVGAWVFARQVAFLLAVRRTADGLSVRRDPGRGDRHTGESTPVTVSASLERPVRAAVSLEPGLPTAASTDDDLSCSLEAGETDATRTATVTWPVAGRHRFDRATATVDDGWFRSSFETGATPEVTVQPRAPRNVHVGEGGDRAVSPYGEHAGGRLGSGVEPAELREYLPGDTIDQIDWKATARRGTTYVRESQSETDLQTVLIVDHRESLSTGPAGETKLDYARETALTAVDVSAGLGDPLGLLTVDDRGISARVEPTSTPAGYAHVRRLLFDLEPSVRAGTDGGSVGSDVTARAPGRRPTVPLVDRGGAILEGEDRFAETLGAYLDAGATRAGRIRANSVAEAIGTSVGDRHRQTFAILVTDDGRPDDVLESVRVLRRRDHDVLVVLAPTVLYERGGLGDLERAYDRYVEFEEFRRSLARMDGVEALEVAPGDRLASVLSAGRERGDRR